MMKIRLQEMSEGHQGLPIPRKDIVKLAAFCPTLRSVEEKQWVSMDGPLAKVPMDVFRVLLRWANSGELRYDSRRTKHVYNALLKACGNKVIARLVKQHEAE